MQKDHAGREQAGREQVATGLAGTRSAEQEKDLADLFLHAAHRIRRRQVEQLAPLGLTPAQARALRIIVGAEEPLRMVELADRLGVVPRSVTALVDALETAGLVTREPDPASRRSTLIRPTPDGRSARAQMAEARRRAAEDVLAPLSTEQRETLRELLAVLDRGSC